MKVLHLISSGGMYGAEAVILNLSNELNRRQRGASCVGVFSHDPERVPALHEGALRCGIASELLPCHGQLDLSVAGSIRRAVRRTGADVVHAHGYKADIYAFLALRGLGRPALVSTCHTWYDNDLAVRAYGAVDRLILRFFDEVVAVSAEVEDRLLRAGVSRQRIRTVRNGVEVRQFAAVAQERRRRAGEGAPARVGLVGRLAPEKGVDVFLRAAADVARRVPETEFFVAGDGPDREALLELLRQLGLEGRARLVGQQGSMTEFYASVDLLVSASRQEGLPMALLEGMASGLPVIATKVGEVPSVVVDGETGLLVPPNSPEALSHAMQTLLLDEAMRGRFGHAGEQRALDDFSAQRMAAEYLAVYQHAISRRPAQRAAAEQSGI